MSERRFDLTDAQVSFPCGDGYTEEVRMRGQIYERVTLTADGAGGLHALVHTMPIDLGGVGLTSGAEYRVTDLEHMAFNRTVMGEIGTYQHMLTVSAPALGPHARHVIGGRDVVNANGEVVVEQPILRGAGRA